MNGLRNYSPEVLATLSNYDLAAQLLADVVAHQAELDELPASTITEQYVLNVKHQLPKLRSFNSAYSAIQNVLHAISAHDMEGAGILYRDWLARNIERQIRTNISDDFEARIKTGASRGGKKAAATATEKAFTKEILALKKHLMKTAPTKERSHAQMIADRLSISASQVRKVVNAKSARKGG